MRVLLQRVTSAEVRVSGRVVGAIDSGLLAFVGMERGDDDASVERMAGRIAGYRMFADEQGRMNRSVRDVGGSVLLCRSSPWRRTPGKACGPVFPGPRSLRRHGACAMRWPPACVIRGCRSPRGNSAPICR